ncbi:MAG: cyclic nucleotide-binding domain-containing protein [Chloroflexota bacterium]
MVSINIFNRIDKTVSFSAGEVIFEVGQPGDVMYAVLDGEVDIIVNKKTMETLKAGDILGEMSLIDNHIRSATAVAKADCKLAVIDQKQFSFLVQQTPFFAIEVMQVMANRIRNMDKLIGD